MTVTFQHRYLALVSEIERNYRVSGWRRGDVDIWPLARMDLFLDMHWRHTAPPAPPRTPRWRRVAAQLATPFVNAWRSRRDLAHWTVWPHRAHAVVLGDGVCLDLIDGAWRDRFGEPVIAELERRGLRTFLMQTGELGRLPWKRATFAANVVDLWSRVAGMVRAEPAALPDLAQVNAYLKSEGVEAPSLARAALKRRAAIVSAAAGAFELILKIVRPRIAFVVTYYAGLGPAFLLACRRRGILSVDLQHCPQGGAHKAYGWSHLPAEGYGVLPAVFWTWSEADSEFIGRWTATLPAPWHRSLHGGDTQLSGCCDPRSDALSRQFGKAQFAREILVALQPIAGQVATWDALARAIEASPGDWRWWIRRHPSSGPRQDGAFGRLFTLRGDNILVEPASMLPLPALLPRMSALVSLMSGAAGEAAMFGVPALFLADEARGQFGELIARGLAHIVEPDRLVARIERLPPANPDRVRIVQPALGEALDRLEAYADDYAALVAGARRA